MATAQVTRRPTVSSVPCTVCQTPSSLAWRHPEANLYRCPSCDHCFSDPASIGEQEQYGPDYYDDTHRNWFENPNLKLFRRLHAVITSYQPQVRILDVGCGRGHLLKYLQERSPSWQFTGVDLGAMPSLPGIEFRHGDAFAMDFGRPFDVVISIAVIEHIIDVHGFVRKLRGLCVSGGLVILLTVNDRSLTYGMARLLRRCGLSGPFNRLYSKHHVNHFNFHSLRQLLQDHGLEVLETIRHHSPLAAIDVPAKNPLIASALRGCAWSLFQLERLTGRTFLQTVICRATPASD
jgi:SAM-dependent methyltransferase